MKQSAIVTEGQSDQDHYPVFWVRLDEIGYRFEAPEFNDKLEGKPYLDTYRRWEEQLFYAARDDNGKYQNLEIVFKALRVDDRMTPLVLGFSRDGRYYAVRGNRRLCCLNVFHSMGILPKLKIVRLDYNDWALVPCRIKHPDDTWDDDTRIREVHPWEQWS